MPFRHSQNHFQNHLLRVCLVLYYIIYRLKESCVVFSTTQFFLAKLRHFYDFFSTGHVETFKNTCCFKAHLFVDSNKMSNTGFLLSAKLPLRYNLNCNNIITLTLLKIIHSYNDERGTPSGLTDDYIYTLERHYVHVCQMYFSFKQKIFS